MLVDQDDADVLAVLGEGIKGGLDGRRLGLAVDDEEVLLRVGRVGDMLHVPSLAKGPCMQPNRREGEPWSAHARPPTPRGDRGNSAYPNTGQQEAGDGVLFPGRRSARGFSVASRSRRRMTMTYVHYLVADDGQELPVLVVGLRGGHGNEARRRGRRDTGFVSGEEAGREVCRRLTQYLALYKGKMHLCSR